MGFFVWIHSAHPTKEIASFVPRAYFSSVTQLTRNICSRILLISQLVLAGTEFVHTDTWLGGNSSTTIENHDCGTREIHKDLDSGQPCLPCYRNTHSIAFPEGAVLSAPIVGTPLAHSCRSLSGERNVASSVPKRGPPILSVV